MIRLKSRACKRLYVSVCVTADPCSVYWKKCSKYYYVKRERRNNLERANKNRKKDRTAHIVWWYHSKLIFFAAWTERKEENLSIIQRWKFDKNFQHKSIFVIRFVFDLLFCFCVRGVSIAVCVVGFLYTKRVSLNVNQ